MTSNETTLFLIALLFLGCFLFSWRGWARAIKINRALVEARNHWKRNYDIASDRLVRLERYNRKIVLAVRDHATPALQRVKEQIDELTRGEAKGAAQRLGDERVAGDTPWTEAEDGDRA